MSWLPVASASIGGGSGGPGPTSPINTTGTKLIVLARYFANTLSFSDPTDNKSNTYTKIDQGSNATAAGQAEFWYCLNPAVGSGHTFTANGQFCGLAVVAYSGAAASSALDQHTFDASANSGTTINTSSVTATQAGELYIAALGLLNGPSVSSYAIDSSFNIDVSLLPVTGGGGYQGVAIASLATTGAQNPQWSGWSGVGSVGGVGLIATFKGASGSPYTLTAASGSFVMTGEPALLKSARKLIAANGNFAMTGEAINLLFKHKLVAAFGSFVMTGQSTKLLAARKLAAAFGSFAMNGQSAGLLAARKLIASVGFFTMTGEPAKLLFNRVLKAAQAAFLMSGQAATLIYGQVGTYTLIAARGIFTITGNAANLLANRKLSAATGHFTLTGIAANLLKGVSNAFAETPRYIFVAVARSRSYVAQARIRIFAAAKRIRGNND